MLYVTKSTWFEDGNKYETIEKRNEKGLIVWSFANEFVDDEQYINAETKEYDENGQLVAHNTIFRYSLTKRRYEYTSDGKIHFCNKVIYDGNINSVEYTTIYEENVTHTEEKRANGDVIVTHTVFDPLTKNLISRSVSNNGKITEMTICGEEGFVLKNNDKEYEILVEYDDNSNKVITHNRLIDRNSSELIGVFKYDQNGHIIYSKELTNNGVFTERCDHYNEKGLLISYKIDDNYETYYEYDDNDNVERIYTVDGNDIHTHIIERQENKMMTEYYYINDELCGTHIYELYYANGPSKRVLELSSSGEVIKEIRYDEYGTITYMDGIKRDVVHYTEEESENDY